MHQRAAVRPRFAGSSSLGSAGIVNWRSSLDLPFVAASHGPVCQAKRSDFARLQRTIADADRKQISRIDPVIGDLDGAPLPTPADAASESSFTADMRQPF